MGDRSRYPAPTSSPRGLMKRFQMLGLMAIYCGFCLGCGDTGQMTASQNSGSAAHEDDHNHGDDHNHPETLDEGLKELVALRDTVRDAFAKNDTETAHGPLHDVGHLLEDITGLIEKRGLSDEAVAAAKQNIETLFDSFGAVDKTMHGQEGSTYNEVSAKIEGWGCGGAKIEAIDEKKQRCGDETEGAE